MAPGNFLPICNSSRFYERQAITSSSQTGGGHCGFDCIFKASLWLSLPVQSVRNLVSFPRL